MWKCLISDYEKYGCVKNPEEFPPRKRARQAIMQRNFERTEQRYGRSMYEPGKATSYEGPMDNETQYERVQTGAKGRINRGHKNHNRQN